MSSAAYIMSIMPNEDIDLMFTNVPIKFKLLAMTQFELVRISAWYSMGMH